MNVNIIDKIIDKNIGWGRALTDIQKQIMDAQSRVRRLRTSLRIIQKKLDNGEPFPLVNATQSPSPGSATQ